MITFLPYPNFKRSVGVLKHDHLRQQRLDAKDILLALQGELVGYNNHPSVNMWQGHEGPLCVYGINACNEWVSRGEKEDLMGFFFDMAQLHETCLEPWWLGLNTFHESHQANLIRKDPRFYVELWPGIPANLPYYWPEPEEMV